MKAWLKLNSAEIIFRVKIALISSLVGVATVLPFIIIYRWDFWALFIRNIIIGLFNGIVGPFVICFFIYRNIRLKPFWSFPAMFIYIALICYGCAAFFGFRDLRLMIVIIAWAELIGLAAMYLIYRYSKRLNEKLRQTQERLQNSQKS
jgi:hypothetical protein